MMCMHRSTDGLMVSAFFIRMLLECSLSIFIRFLVSFCTVVKRHKGNQVILFLPAYFEWLAGHISYYNYISKDSCIVGEQQHKECKLLPCFLSLLLIGFGTLTLCSQCTMHTTAFAGGV